MRIFRNSIRDLIHRLVPPTSLHCRIFECQGFEVVFILICAATRDMEPVLYCPRISQGRGKPDHPVPASVAHAARLPHHLQPGGMSDGTMSIGRLGVVA